MGVKKTVLLFDLGNQLALFECALCRDTVNFLAMPSPLYLLLLACGLFELFGLQQLFSDFEKLRSMVHPLIFCLTLMVFHIVQKVHALLQLVFYSVPLLLVSLRLLL